MMDMLDITLICELNLMERVGGIFSNLGVHWGPDLGSALFKEARS